MNTKNNQRSKKTQEDIWRVFIEMLMKKDIADMTVSGICAKAKINRSTFYAHYIDIYDLLEKMEEEMSSQMVNAIVNNTQSISEGFENLFAYFQRNARFYTAYFEHANNTNLLKIILPPPYEASRRTLIKEMGYVSEEVYHYHESFFIAGITGLIRRWLSRGCQESPKEMCDIIGMQYNQNRQFFEWKEK